MSKFVVENHGEELWVRYRCPGCKQDHAVPAKRWNWNGDTESPTLSPSVRHFCTKPDGTEITTCHYHIRAGRIQFCGDCRHELKGQTVELPHVDS